MLLRARTTHSRPGIVLLAVLVVIVLLTLAAYQYSELMMAEAKSAESYYRSVQTRALADSGVHYVAALLSNSDSITNTLNGNIYENPTAYQNILVQDDPNGGRRIGRFSIFALRDPDDPNAATSPWRYGVVDEAGKINVNALLALDNGKGDVAFNLLMKLPNMTESIANCIIDWLDPDDTPRTDGAENDYYTSLTPYPYKCKNGPLDSLEEMLLIKGVTTQLLFGNDRNRNGILDPDEDDGSGQVDLGWSAFLTVYSRETNVDSQGNPRIYLNDPDLNSLSDNLSTALGQDAANFIIAYLIYGGSSGGGGGASAGGGGGAGAGGVAAAGAGGATKGAATPTTTAPASGSGYKALTGQDADDVSNQLRTARTGSGSGGGQKNKVSSLYDLITGTVSVPVGTGQQQRYITMYSPFSDPGQQRDLLPKLFDLTTTTKQMELSPRINVNTASMTVLSALTGLAPDQVQTIIDKRPPTSSDTPPDTIYQTPAWLITDANIPVATLKSLESYLTAQTQVYRVQVLGYFDSGGATSRIEAIIDTNNGRPRIVYWRDLAELGKGFNPNAN